ncbi:hypothetical protein TWF281_002998 [Arthrobotrys megalospora]
MDRLLRRKPAKPAKPEQYVLRDPSYYQPSQLQITKEYSSPYRPSAAAYYENVEKSSESAVAASQTIKSLEAAYTNRRSLSYPPPKIQAEVKPQHNHAQQENAHLRRRSASRSTASYGQETAVSGNGHRGSGAGSESTVTLAHAISTNGAEVSEPTNAYQSFNEAPFNPFGQGVREPEARSLRSTRYSRQSSGDDKQQHAPWTRLSGFNRFDEPSPISPTTSPNPSIRPPSFAENTSNTSLEEPKSAKQLFKDKIFWSNESQAFIPEALQAEPESVVSSEKDDDDLSSICSEDSYVEKERTKYYETMVTDAVNIRDWKAAKKHAAKLKEILGLQKEQSPLDPQTQANYFLLCATIHYMLAELDDALFWIGKIPQKKSTDPTLLMNKFNMEAAISIRQGHLDDAFAISRKSGKYGRKFGLAKETNHALFLSQLICLKRDDTSEAQFYGQMITEKDFKLPIFIETIDAPPEEEPAQKKKRSPEEVYSLDPLPTTPHLPPKSTRQSQNLGESLFAMAGLCLRPGHTGSKSAPEYQGGTVNWMIGIRLAIDADDDSESACYLYRTVYINDPIAPPIGEAGIPPGAKPVLARTNPEKEISPLEHAIIKHRTYAAVAIIKQKKAKLEDDGFEAQPLQLATAQANLPIIVALLQAGVDPHKVGTHDTVPALEKAASASYYEGCHYLLAYGADPLRQGPGKLNALKVALEGPWTAHREKVLIAILGMMSTRPQYDTIAKYLKTFNIKRDLGSSNSGYPTSFLQPNPVWNDHISRLLSEYLETFRHLKEE